MKKVLSMNFALGWLLVALGAESSKFYEDAVSFTAFSFLYPDGKLSTFEDDIWNFGCVPYFNYTIVVHGYGEKIDERPWIKEMVNKFLHFRYNCVFFMDYSNFSSGGYFDLTPHFDKISAVLAKKILTLGNTENTVLFGFSFGARLAIDAGILVAAKGAEIDRIYACDPAGPGFGWYRKDSKKAAKYVECIHTSNDKGTTNYDCHRNWRLGKCGNSQLGSSKPPFGSHGLCPYFFNAAFDNDFAADNYYKCASKRKAEKLPSDLIMGPRESRLSFAGDVFAPTARKSPWNVVNNVIDN